HRPRPVEAMAEIADRREVQGVPAAEGDLAHLAPDRALMERLPAPAEAILSDAAIPDVTELARGEHARHLAEHPVEQRAPAAAPARDEQDARGRPRRDHLVDETCEPRHGRRDVARPGRHAYRAWVGDR